MASIFSVVTVNPLGSGFLPFTRRKFQLSKSKASAIAAFSSAVGLEETWATSSSFEEAIADRYTKTEAETLIAAGTNDLVADLDVNLTNGVITVTKKDGTVETFDTAIEKVPAKFEIVENGETYALKITNVDGTTTQADITNFMNIYNFNNSDYITFEVTGEGTEKTVTANIKANSIGLDKLSLSVVSTLEGYMTSARDSATAAKTSETNARASELNALEAKNTSITKAQEASTSASNAKTSETNAEYWAKKAEAIGGGSTSTIYNVTIPTTGWSAESPYTIELNVTGMMESDKNFVVSPVYNIDNSDTILEAWSKVTLIESATNKIKVYCKDELPTVEIPIQITVVR